LRRGEERRERDRERERIKISMEKSEIFSIIECPILPKNAAPSALGHQDPI